MARALFTEEQVFEVADSVAAEGKEVTALVLLSKLGGGSLTTIYKHLIKWQQARQELPQAQQTAIPEPVQAAFAVALGRTWAAVSQEAAKEVQAIKEKTDQEVSQVRKEFEGALTAIEQLEKQSDADTAEIENLKARNTELESSLQKTENENSALKATIEELRQQVKSQDTEIERLHKAVESERQKQTDNLLKAVKQQNEEFLSKLSQERKK